MRQTVPDPQWAVYSSELGRTLQRVRLAAGMSQELVAYRAGLSRYTYQKYEKGESRPGSAANPSLRSILAIAQVLGVDIQELLPGDIPDLTGR